MLMASDIIGTIGVGIVLLAYFFLQTEVAKYNDYIYLALNALGSALILFSLVYKFNPAAFLIESCWVAISIYGALRRWEKDRKK